MRLREYITNLLIFYLIQISIVYFGTLIWGFLDTGIIDFYLTDVEWYFLLTLPSLGTFMAFCVLERPS